MNAKADDTVSRETDLPHRSAQDHVSRETALPRRLVIVNQKGGVGKTTTAVNLAVALAQEGQRVLVCDLDPQGNASTALGIEHRSGTPSSYEVLLDQDPIAEHAQQSPESENLWVLPATIDLAGAEIELVPQVAREQRLLKALRKYEARQELDFVLFDCPPSLGLLTLNALVAATEVLVPIQAEYYALEGLTALMRTISLVKEELNPELQITGVVLTMFDARTKLATQVGEEVKKHFPNEMLQTIVPRSVRMSEAPSYGQTIFTYDPQSVGAKAYRKVALEIMARGPQAAGKAKRGR